MSGNNCMVNSDVLITQHQFMANLFHLYPQLPSILLLLLLSCFSCVRLCATPQTAAHLALPSLGFSRQEYWSGLPFPLQCMKVKVKSCLTYSDPMDCSLPGSSIHGTFPERVLECVAIAFSIQLPTQLPQPLTTILPFFEETFKEMGVLICSPVI